MDAPIPASALIHSATLVSAGIYLLLRFPFLTTNTVFFKPLLIFLLLTLIIIGIQIAFQRDLKRLLAFSTITNCSFLYFLIITKNYSLCLLFFSVHGFLKSNIFLYTGSFILANNHYQSFLKFSITDQRSLFSWSFLITHLILLSAAPGSMVELIKH